MERVSVTLDGSLLNLLGANQYFVAANVLSRYKISVHAKIIFRVHFTVDCIRKKIIYRYF